MTDKGTPWHSSYKVLNGPGGVGATCNPVRPLVISLAVVVDVLSPVPLGHNLKERAKLVDT